MAAAIRTNSPRKPLGFTMKTHEPRPSRRSFVRFAAGAAIAPFAIGGTKASGRILGANDTIRVAVAGINSRGGAHIDEFAKMKGVQVTYLVDPDSRLFKSRAESVKSRGGNVPKAVQDIRRALEDKDIDVVSVATCNHWHSLITIWACQAGKDVYVEKPLSHNIHEGRIALDVARKHGRIVQHGTQNRSSKGVARDVAAAQSGKYGKLLVSKGYCHKPRWSIDTKPVTSPPEGFDFNIWLGPAPEQPFHGNLVHYNWHWFWDFGNGDIGNQGVHQIDIARWAIKDATLPKSVVSFGGRYGYVDQGQTPNTLMTVFDFGDVKLVFETLGLVEGKSHAKGRVDHEFFTEQGRITGGKFYPSGGGPPERLADVPPIEVHDGGHFGNFINAVRSRRHDELNADIKEAHYSSALCHLANASYRVGNELSYADARKQLNADAHTAELFGKMVFNLFNGNDINVEAEQIRIGPVLKFDPATEKFIDNPLANDLLTRKYRPPFVVPEKA
ncbi:MAG: Gfo/Idh/MocA family oxidoreductase [Pirellulales bacterium]